MRNDDMRQALFLRAQSDNKVMIALQDALVANSLTKRVKTEKINHGDLIISAKRTNTVEDILTKAQRLAAKRNLELSESSFISFYPEVITSNCENIGITLGSMENQVLQLVVAIKNIEIDRLVVAPSSYSRNPLIDDEEAELDAELSYISIGGMMGRI
jgi:hypothetical protein